MRTRVDQNPWKWFSEPIGQLDRIGLAPRRATILEALKKSRAGLIHSCWRLETIAGNLCTCRLDARRSQVCGSTPWLRYRGTTDRRRRVRAATHARLQWPKYAHPLLAGPPPPPDHVSMMLRRIAVTERGWSRPTRDVMPRLLRRSIQSIVAALRATRRSCGLAGYIRKDAARGRGLTGIDSAMIRKLRCSL